MLLQFLMIGNIVYYATVVATQHTCTSAFPTEKKEELYNRDLCRNS